MAGAEFDEVAALVYGAELLDGGVDEYAAWAEAMMTRFEGRGLRTRLRAIHAMARELRLHQPADRTCVAPQIIAHRTPPAASGTVPHQPPDRPISNEYHAAAAAFTLTAGRRGAAPVPTNIVVVGHRGSWMDLIMSGLVCVMLAGVMISGELGIGVLLIAFLVVSSFLSRLRRTLRPSQLSVHNGVFSIQLDAHYETPTANVSQLMMAGGVTGIIFRDLREVSPQENQLNLARQIDKSGVHLIVAPGVFTLDQINQVRHALGLAPQSRDESASRLTGFYETLAALTPHPFVTPAIVIANVVVFAAVAVASGTVGIPDQQVMLDWGANFGPFTTGGQWWRLFTSMFLHFGLLHILFNMWVLWDVGRLVERLVGNLAYAVAYLTSGFLGSVASVMWNSHVFSAGASGAVFGVFGILLGFMSLHRKSIPGEAINAHRNAALAFVAFNLIFGFSITWIDMAAHVGGLVAGFACGLLLSQEISRDAVRARRVRTAILMVASILVCGTAVWLLPMLARNDSETTANWRTELARLALMEKQVLNQYNKSADQANRKEISEREFADLVETEMLPPWRAGRQQFVSALPNLPDKDPNIAARLTQQLQLQEQAWQLLVQGIREGDATKRELSRRKAQAADEIRQELSSGK